MSRKQQISWIKRWWRVLIAGLAATGAAVTAYLTILRFTGNSAACPVNGCDIVLTSPYATVLGLPLALFGFLAYTSMIGFAIAPLVFRSAPDPEKKQSRSWLETRSGLFLFMGGTAMMVFSGYLMYLLAFEIRAVCVYCVASAVLSTSLFVLSLVGQEWLDIGQPLFLGGVVAIVALVGSLGIYANVNNPSLAESGTEVGSYSIASQSGAAEIALVQHLNQVGAKMYGAFTCPHCQNQKYLLGKEAASQLNYVECHPEGKNARPDLCQAAGIQGFPTWEIKGKLYQGEKSLGELADLSGYQGNRGFQITPLPGH